MGGVPLPNPPQGGGDEEFVFSVIVSAYNNMDALVRALPFWQVQTEQRFELLVADDGSNEEQRKLFQAAATKTGLTVRHIWHEDNGFAKCGILNKAILVARAPRLLFLDADMLPRFDLVANHLALLKPNRFISGGSHVNVNEAGQEHIAGLCRNGIPDVFKTDVLSESGFILKKKQGRVGKFGAHARVYDLLTWRTNAFSGANASCWKADALRINGFDEAWGYGGLDRDFGIRLTNAGVTSRRYQYSLVALHQNHKRPYRDALKVKENKRQLKNRMASKTISVESGISKHAVSDVQVVWQQNA